MAGFGCPACGAGGGLAITARLELGGDSDSDEIALQCVECAACGFRGVAVYEESRRGRLDSESWNHTGYRVAPAAWDALAGLLAACPQPHNDSCPCATHQALRVYDAQGWWAGLAPYAPHDPFPMRFAP